MGAVKMEAAGATWVGARMEVERVGARTATVGEATVGDVMVRERKAALAQMEKVAVRAPAVARVAETRAMVVSVAMAVRVVMAIGSEVRHRADEGC